MTSVAISEELRLSRIDKAYQLLRSQDGSSNLERDRDEAGAHDIRHRFVIDVAN